MALNPRVPICQDLALKELGVNGHQGTVAENL